MRSCGAIGTVVRPGAVDPARHDPNCFSSCGMTLSAVRSPTTISVAFAGWYAAAWKDFRSAVVKSLIVAAVPTAPVPYRCDGPNSDARERQRRHRRRIVPRLQQIA